MTYPVAQGGLLSGTDGWDKLYGGDSEDKVSGLDGSGERWGGFGGDYVMDGGSGNDFLVGSTNHEDGHDKNTDYLLGERAMMS
jgi:hypothetical protein